MENGPKSLENQLATLKMQLANANTAIRTLHGDIEFPHINQKRLVVVKAEMEKLGQQFDKLIAEQDYLEATLDTEKAQARLEEAYSVRNQLSEQYNSLASEYNTTTTTAAVVAKATPKLDRLLAKLGNLSPESLEAFMLEASKLLPPTG